MWRAGDTNRSKNIVAFPNELEASEDASRIESSSWSGVSTSLIPRPPPPADAFTSSGNPTRAASRSADAKSSGSISLAPGTIGTPACSIICRPDTLSPRFLMESAVGPMNLIPAASHASTNSAFSDKNPYPGWIASAPVSFAASIIFGILR